jgi:hypothetical protein
MNLTKKNAESENPADPNSKSEKQYSVVRLLLTFDWSHHTFYSVTGYALYMEKDIVVNDIRKRKTKIYQSNNIMFKI